MEDLSASEQIDAIIKTYGGWKGETLARLRAVINGADPTLVEEIKWKMRSRPEGLPVWSHKGIVCLVETFKNDMKLVFAKGYQIEDPKQLFNARLKSKTDRAIEFHEGDEVDEEGVKQLVLEAVQINDLRAKKQ